MREPIAGGDLSEDVYCVQINGGVSTVARALLAEERALATEETFVKVRLIFGSENGSKFRGGSGGCVSDKQGHSRVQWRGRLEA